MIFCLLDFFLHLFIFCKYIIYVKESEAELQSMFKVVIHPVLQY